MLPLGFIISPTQRYLWSFITKFVMDIVTTGKGIKELLFIVAVFSIISLVVSCLQTFYNNKVFVQCIVVRMRVILQKNLLFFQNFGNFLSFLGFLINLNMFTEIIF